MEKLLVICPQCKQSISVDDTPLRRMGIKEKDIRRIAQSTYRINDYRCCNTCIGSNDYIIADRKSHRSLPSMCPASKYWYTDESSICSDCGKRFTFTKERQKYRYEKLHIPVDVVCRQCTSCRKQRWAIKKLNVLVPQNKRHDSLWLQDMIKQYTVLGNTERIHYYANLLKKISQ